MKIIELDKRYCRECYGGDFKKMLRAGDGLVFDDARIKSAFAFGRGTAEDMRRYMRDNAVYARFYDAEKQCFIA